MTTVWKHESIVFQLKKNLMIKYILNKELAIQRVFISWGMAEQVIVYVCNGILLSHKKWRTGWFQKNLERLTWTDAKWCERTKRILYTVTAVIYDKQLWRTWLFSTLQLCRTMPETHDERTEGIWMLTKIYYIS